MKPNFSVVLIARNEAKTLPRLLESLKEFRDRGGEVVLVDTGSKDNTAELARAAGCVVEEVGTRFQREITPEQAAGINAFLDPSEKPIVEAHTTLFDYSSARNYAATLSSCDMIATPDCDEVWTKLNIDAINQAIADGVEQLEYNFVFAHDAEGGELVKFMHSKFYDRRKLRWVGIIHEVLTGEAKRQFFHEDTIKLEHWQNVETNRTGYLKGLALAILEDPNNDRNSHYFGRELMYTGRPRSAIKELRRHVEMNKWAEERSQSLVHIGECHMMLGETREAIHAWIDAFDACPTRREALMKIAEYYYSAGSPDHVIAYVAAALQIKEGNFYANFTPYYQQMPHELMYWALWQKGEYNASKRHFDLCFAYQPFNSKYLHDYRYYYELPTISIVVPTLRDSAALQKTISSISSLNYPQEKIQTITLFDEPRLGVPKRVKEGVEKSTGEWIVYAADDMEFTPDCIMAALKTAWDARIKFMAFNAGEVLPDQGNICEHFMIHRDLLPKINGEIFDTEFYHVGVDNLLWAQMKKLHQAMWCKRAVVLHRHFSRTSEGMDAVNKLAWNEERVAHDRALLVKKLDALKIS